MRTGWRDLETFFTKALRHEYLNSLVKQKTAGLLAKLELLD